MVLGQLAEYLTPQQDTKASSPPFDLGSNGAANDTTAFPAQQQHTRRKEEGVLADTGVLESSSQSLKHAVAEPENDAYRPPYLHAMLSGGLGGTTGDMLMHSLDTVKTRQQGDPHMPPKYTSMGNTYYTIFRQEGVVRGLYGGVTPAFLGSFSGTMIFFGCYEWSKRWMLAAGIPDWASYLTAGLVADLMASPLYVPSEVLKTRLQLQGRYNNPFFSSGYNYRSTLHALRTIRRTEGIAELFSGYKATLFRDLPFSALQFAFYEQELKLAQRYVGPGKDIGLGLEILTGASAGGLAGVMTCPMDVVKTRIQTELDPDLAAAAKQQKQKKKNSAAASSSARASASSVASKTATMSSSTSPPARAKSPPSSAAQSPPSRKHISTSGPSTTLARHGPATLDTESVIKALRIIYQSEGFAGWFRGVGPRFVWTSVQSGTMLVVYQRLLRWFQSHPLVEDV